MTTETTVPPVSELAQTSDNRIAVEVMLDYLALPAPSVTARPDAVYVSVADVDDLGAWLTARGGRVHVHPAGDGVELWTLLTSSPERADGSSVPIRVSAPVPAGEVVLGYIVAAVAA
ncbi:hypothetical protein [Streptomyces sp. NPDC047028]|uniref:hypothetical protein n=1 Tax=Streptomyces sp. NPDC047028 TaxID=3155793 RepID=UPI0033F18E19